MRDRSSTANVHYRAPVVCVLTFFFLALTPASWGASYYVDGNNPDARDTNPGTESQPFQTIGKATSLVNAGDTVFVKAGTYRETVILNKSGSAARTVGRTGATTGPAPITITAYPGHEGKAIINAAEPVVHWRKCRPDECAGNRHWNQIYWADVAALVQSHPDHAFVIRQVLQNGQVLPRSRYPNAGWLYPPPYAPPGVTTFFCDGLPPRAEGYFTGSVCHVQTAVWHLDQIPVVASVPSTVLFGKQPMLGSTLTLAAKPRYEISWVFGFYLTNLVGEINEEGEWAYEPALKRLYLWPQGGQPQNVEISYRQYCLRAYEGTSWNIVRGLTMRNAHTYGIWFYHASDNTVENNTVENTFGFGIYFQAIGGASERNQILRNTVRYSCSRGIGVDGAANNLEGNYVYATGTDSFGGALMNGPSHGMYVNGPYIRVYNNRIDRTGYTGLYVSGKTLSRDISYNHITNSCLSLSDGAGIYMAGYSNVPEKDHIHHNIVTDTIGCLSMVRYRDTGIPPTIETHSGEAPGIYVDEGGNNRIIEHNTIIGSGMAGIFFHLAPSNVVQHNTLYGNRVAQVYLVGDNQPNKALVDDILSDNTLFATDDGQRTLYLSVNYEDVRFGQSDRNCFYHPYRSAHIFVNRHTSSGEWIRADLTLDGWRALSGYDGSSREFSHWSQAVGVASESPTWSKIICNPSLDAITVDLEPDKYWDVQGNPIRGAVTLAPFESKILICADFAVSGPPLPGETP